MNGPTIWRCAEGSARRTSNPPMSRARHDHLLDGVAGKGIARDGIDVGQRGHGSLLQ
jgi:hypothetical protein